MDGLLLTRREKTWLFCRRLAAAFAGPALLAAVAVALGSVPSAIAIAFVGGLLALMLATSVGSDRGALAGGSAVAVFLLVVQILLAWLVSHPILPE